VSRFRYRGRSGRGDLITGRLEAETMDAVAARLLNLGITPLQIDADSDRSTSLEELLRRLGAGRPSTVDLVLFSRQMYAITKSGLPLLRGLRGLAESTHNVVMRDALHDVLQSLESGRDLASSLARHPTIFSSLFISMVRVGNPPAHSTMRSCACATTWARIRMCRIGSRRRCATRLSWSL
jgi:MSHA biogenesis protein MshG